MPSNAAANRIRHRQEVLRARIAAGSIARAPSGHLHRPGELVVDENDRAAVEGRLRALGIASAPIGGPVHGVQHLRIDGDLTVPEVLASLRHPDPATGRRPVVAPNHVLVGTPGNIMPEGGGPSAFAEPANPPRAQVTGSRGRVKVGILDTGLALAGRDPEHPALAGVRVLDATKDGDAPGPNGALADQSGHGTFIAGIVRRTAPEADIMVHRALDDEGFVSEVEVRDELLRLVKRHRPDVLNLSFGGYTDHDNPMLALGAALAGLDSSIVVVAAAGNQALPRPLWPAAAKRVIAVGALGKDATPATYSDFGWWVDAWAPGHHVSTFFLDDQAPAVRLAGGRTVQGPRLFGGWATWEGTSFATAAVTGAIASRAQADTTSAREAAHALTQGPDVRRVADRFGGGAIVA